MYLGTVRYGIKYPTHYTAYNFTCDIRDRDENENQSLVEEEVVVLRYIHSTLLLLPLHTFT